MAKISSKCTQHSDRDGVRFRGIHCAACGAFVFVVADCEECSKESNETRMSNFYSRLHEAVKAHEQTQFHIDGEKAWNASIGMW